MSTKTRYILQGLFFLILAIFCLYSHYTGKAPWLQRYSTIGTILCAVIGIICIKNGLKK